MLKIDPVYNKHDLSLELMGYLIPVTPQAFVNRISIFGPDETNIKEISYQLSLHLTIPINIFTPPKSLELYIVADIIWGRGWGAHRST